MNQRERIANGLLFTDLSKGLPEDRLRGKEYAFEYNHTRPSDIQARINIARKMLGRIGDNFWIEPPIHFAYGSNIFIGDNFYANVGLTLIDATKIFIGNKVLIGADVTMGTTGHPIDLQSRATTKMYAFEVSVEDGVWIGSGAIVGPGVTVGKNSVIGTGNVLTSDIGANVVAVGNPCRVLREIGEHDKKYYFRDGEICPEDYEAW